MKVYLVLIICFSLFACQQGQQTTQSKQAEPQYIQATLFEAGNISSEAPEFATSVNAEHNLMFFNRTTADRSSMWIMYATREGNRWSSPERLSFSTGQYRDVDPFISHDGSRLYFSSNRPTPITSLEDDVFNTWFVDKRDSGWSDPILAESPLNSDSTEIFISMTRSGNAYFVSERKERNGRGIMRCTYEAGQYQEAEVIQLSLRGEPVYASNPCIASDGSFLIVACRDPEGPGTPDLFVSWNQNGEWSDMMNLGESVNSPYAEFAPGLSKDDQILYFSSERPGLVAAQPEGVRPPGDIYQVNIQPVLDQIRHRSLSSSKN